HEAAISEQYEEHETPSDVRRAIGVLGMDGSSAVASHAPFPQCPDVSIGIFVQHALHIEDHGWSCAGATRRPLRQSVRRGNPITGEADPGMLDACGEFIGLCARSPEKVCDSWSIECIEDKRYFDRMCRPVYATTRSRGPVEEIGPGRRLILDSLINEVGRWHPKDTVRGDGIPNIIRRGTRAPGGIRIEDVIAEGTAQRPNLVFELRQVEGRSFREEHPHDPHLVTSRPDEHGHSRSGSSFHRVTINDDAVYDGRPRECPGVAIAGGH